MDENVWNNYFKLKQSEQSVFLERKKKTTALSDITTELLIKPNDIVNHMIGFCTILKYKMIIAQNPSCAGSNFNAIRVIYTVVFKMHENIYLVVLHNQSQGI